jgi:predicted DNA-binding mobile mystery protein A
MNRNDAVTARRMLDRKLESLRNPDVPAAPRKGWIRAIREALGMTTAQLARRMGVVQSRIPALEQAEARGAVTLASLEKAAHALDCRLVYVLVPRQPLQELVNHRARRKAEGALAVTRHSMALEAQPVERDDEREQLERLVRELAARGGSALWDDDE